MSETKARDNVVKIRDSVVIVKDYDVRINFGDGYVLIRSDSDKPLTRAEVLYYLELAAFRYKEDITK